MEQKQPTTGETSYLETAPLDPATQRIDDSFNKWQLNTMDVIETIMHNWNGDTFDYETGSWEINKDPKKAMLNKSGIMTAFGLLTEQINRIPTLSNLQPKNVQIISSNFALDLSLHFGQNHKKYGLEKHDIPRIVNPISHLNYYTLCRALQAGERNAVSRMIKSIERTVIGENKKSRIGI